jgi:hypothetical protein
MIPNHAYTQDPLTLRQLAQEYRREALAALRIPSTNSLRLSRYWPNIGRARALAALDRAGFTLSIAAVQGGQR